MYNRTATATATTALSLCGLTSPYFPRNQLCAKAELCGADSATSPANPYVMAMSYCFCHRRTYGKRKEKGNYDLLTTP